MKVCLLNDSFPPVIDGVVNVMMNYATYLMENHGSQVMVGTPNYPGADYTKYAYPVIPYQSLDTASITNGYRTGNPFDEKAVSQMADFGPDIIHSHCPASATVIARILREKSQAPLIFTYHTKYDIDIQRAVKVKPIAEEGIRAMVGNIEACDDVWVVSRGAGESLKALGFSGDYLVMNNGVDFARGRVDMDTVEKVTKDYDLPKDLPMFLYVGRMMNYKNLPLILDALAQVAKEGRDFRMVFIGKGPDQESLEEKAKSLGLMGKPGEKDKCLFIGPVYDRDVLRAWNTRADLFLFPSTFDTNGLVVREAAACGLASVLVADSCASEGITDGRNGFLIQENADSLAAFLLKAMKDIPHLKDAGTHAMEEIYLSWPGCVATAYDRYQFILEEKKAGRLQPIKRQGTDKLVSMTALSMEQQNKIRAMGKELYNNFQVTATGMMENFQEAEVNAELLRSRYLENLGLLKARAEQGMEQLRSRTEESMEQLRSKTEESMEQLRAKTEENMEQLKAKTEEGMQQLKARMTRTLEDDKK